MIVTGILVLSSDKRNLLRYQTYTGAFRTQPIKQGLGQKTLYHGFPFVNPVLPRWQFLLIYGEYFPKPRRTNSRTRESQTESRRRYPTESSFRERCTPGELEPEGPKVLLLGYVNTSNI